MGPKRAELRDRLAAALKPPKNTPVLVTANEMRNIRIRCRELGIDYGKLLTEVCQELSARRAT